MPEAQVAHGESTTTALERLLHYLTVFDILIFTAGLVAAVLAHTDRYLYIIMGWGLLAAAGLIGLRFWIYTKGTDRVMGLLAAVLVALLGYMILGVGPDFKMS